MKVLHIDTGENWRGGQQQALNLAVEMQKIGIETALVCPIKSSLYKNAKDAGLTCFGMNIKGLFGFIAAYKISRLCHNRGYNIIALHSANAHSIGLVVKMFYSKVKLVCFRRVDFKVGQNFLSLWKYNTPILDKIVAVSNNVKEILINCGVDESKISIIPDGVELDRFSQLEVTTHFRNTEGISEKVFVVGTIAAVAGHKDYPTFLKAAKKILDQNQNVLFISLGDGPLLQEMKEMAKNLKIDDKFLFKGFREDVGMFLKTFDIFVLASKKEGMGSSILDAMALGKPVVACRTGGIVDIIESEKNGLLVDKKNDEELAKAIERLINDKSLREKFAKSGFERVKEFDVSKTAKTTVELFEGLVNGI